MSVQEKKFNSRIEMLKFLETHTLVGGSVKGLTVSFTKATETPSAQENAGRGAVNMGQESVAQESVAQETMTVTQEDLDANPALVEGGINVGDVGTFDQEALDTQQAAENAGPSIVD